VILGNVIREPWFLAVALTKEPASPGEVTRLATDARIVRAAT
jgi:hypothetical protein